jgi:hypothetical protein
MPVFYTNSSVSCIRNKHFFFEEKNLQRIQTDKNWFYKEWYFKFLKTLKKLLAKNIYKLIVVMR